MEPTAQEMLAQEFCPPRDQPTRPPVFQEVRLGSGSWHMAPSSVLSLFSFISSPLPSLGTSLHGGTRQGLRFSPQQQMSGALLGAIFNRNNLLPGRLAGKSVSHWGVLYASISQHATGDMVLKTHLTKESELLQSMPKYSQWEIRCFFTTELTPFPTNTLGASFQGSLAIAAM